MKKQVTFEFVMENALESDLSTYPDLLRRFRQRHDEFNILKPILKELATNEDFIKDAETALSVGTGFGQYDIEFFRYFSKLKKLIIVEKDPDCVKELIPNLKNCFGDKVEFEIHEISIEKFMKQEASLKLHKKLDVVASFHGLLFLNSDDRREFFRFCFNFWLKPTKGKLVVLNPSRDDAVTKCCEEMSPDMISLQDSTMLKEELNSMSVTFERDIFYTIKLDLNQYDEDLSYFFGCGQTIPVDKDLMKTIIKKNIPDGIGDVPCELIIARC